MTLSSSPEQLLNCLRSQHHLADIELGLDRIKVILEHISLPQFPFTYVLAGTNGKGTCAALLANAFHSLGISWALYSSPHVRNFNERALINNDEVPDEEWCLALHKIEEARRMVDSTLGMTYFEYCTLAALWLFSRRKLDVWILEIGLGGRLDAVNIVDADCSIITSIGLDHTDILGDTREAILVEKIGIARANKPLICAEPSPPPNLDKLVHSIGAELFNINRDYGRESYELSGIEFLGEGDVLYAHNSKKLVIKRSSAYLTIHYATAWQALCLWGKKDTLRQESIECIQRSWEIFSLEGRWQQEEVGKALFIFDGAHNPQAMNLLAHRLAKMQQPIEMVFGIMRDKDLSGVVAPLLDVIQRWHLFPLSAQRALEVEQIERHIRGAGKQVSCYQNGTDLVTRLKEEQKTFIVSGSFHTVGEILDVLRSL